jgi:hypothetical protein
MFTPKPGEGGPPVPVAVLEKVWPIRNNGGMEKMGLDFPATPNPR